MGSETIAVGAGLSWKCRAVERIYESLVVGARQPVGVPLECRRRLGMSKLRGDVGNGSSLLQQQRREGVAQVIDAMTG